jgi:hypothetical protein
VAALDTLASEIERFLVPLVDGSPDPAGEPELGWPGGAEPPPLPVEGTSPAESSGANKLAASGLTAGEFAGGSLAAPPYWDGATVVNNTADEIEVETDAKNPAGEQSGSVTATEDEQLVFELLGAPEVSEFSSVKRVSDELLLAIDDANPEHDPASGIFAIHPPEDPEIIHEDDELEVVYFLVGPATVPAGVGFLVAAEHTPTVDFTTGDAWAGAYTEMVYAGSPPPGPGTLDGAKSAMKGVIDGMMIPGMFAPALSLGALAFWSVVAGSAATIWSALGTAYAAIPPPGVAALGPAMLAAGAACLALGPGTGMAYPEWDPQLPKDAALILATALHTASQGAQIMTQPGPVPVPVPFVLT